MEVRQAGDGAVMHGPVRITDARRHERDPELRRAGDDVLQRRQHEETVVQPPQGLILEKRQKPIVAAGPPRAHQDVDRLAARAAERLAVLGDPLQPFAHLADPLPATGLDGVAVHQGERQRRHPWLRPERVRLQDRPGRVPVETRERFELLAAAHRAVGIDRLRGGVDQLAAEKSAAPHQPGEHPDAGIDVAAQRRRRFQQPLDAIVRWRVVGEAL